MKTYRWNPETKTVTILNGSRTTQLKPALIFSTHFDCGSLSNESQELAVSILLDYSGWIKSSFKHTLEFTKKIIDKNPRMHWEITGDEISIWNAVMRLRHIRENKAKSVGVGARAGGSA